MRYVAPFMFALAVFVCTSLILGILTSQIFDGITGKWVLIPIIGQLLLPLGLGICAWRRWLKPLRPPLNAPR